MPSRLNPQKEMSFVLLLMQLRRPADNELPNPAPHRNGPHTGMWAPMWPLCSGGNVKLPVLEKPPQLSASSRILEVSPTRTLRPHCPVRMGRGVGNHDLTHLDPEHLEASLEADRISSAGMSLHVAFLNLLSAKS